MIWRTRFGLPGQADKNTAGVDMRREHFSEIHSRHFGPWCEKRRLRYRGTTREDIDVADRPNSFTKAFISSDETQIRVVRRASRQAQGPRDDSPSLRESS